MLGVEGLGFRIWVLSIFRVEGFGFRIGRIVDFRVEGLGFGIGVLWIFLGLVVFRLRI